LRIVTGTVSNSNVELSDADLLARVLVDGDQHAFGELVRRHQSPVRGLLRQLTRTDVELADDLAQETFIRAHKNIRGFRGEAKFSTWLYRVAYNVFREHARKRRELVGIDEEQLKAQADPQTTDPALRHDLMNAISQLPLHERTAIVLCCQNGLSHDEAARVLEIPLGTVKTNVLRGREKLKKMLAAWST
jgi:RNA polymerase sigma factor (sigma-70 family)